VLFRSIGVGDVLHRFDGLPVGGIRHLLGLLAARGAVATVSLSMARGGAPREVSITLVARPSRLGCR
jgi:S1-C subfamily serine protease